MPKLAITHDPESVLITSHSQNLLPIKFTVRDWVSAYELRAGSQSTVYHFAKDGDSHFSRNAVKSVKLRIQLYPASSHQQVEAFNSKDFAFRILPLARIRTHRSTWPDIVGILMPTATSRLPSSAFTVFPIFLCTADLSFLLPSATSLLLFYCIWYFLLSLSALFPSTTRLVSKLYSEVHGCSDSWTEAIGHWNLIMAAFYQIRNKIIQQ